MELISVYSSDIYLDSVTETVVFNFNLSSHIKCYNDSDTVCCAFQREELGFQFPVKSKALLMNFDNVLCRQGPAHIGLRWVCCTYPRKG